MNPERKKLRSVLSYMSGFGLLISTGIHIATLRDINIEKDYPFIFTLHLMAIASGFLLVAVFRLEKIDPKKFNTILLKSVWPLVLVVASVLYTGYCFLDASPHLGTFAESNGGFVMKNRSTVVQVFADRERFEQAEKISGVMNTRYFSAFWLSIFGVAFMFLRASRRIPPSTSKDHSKSPNDNLRVKIESRELIEVPLDELLSFEERMKKTSWRLIKFIFLPKAGALWLLGIVFQNGLLLFAGTFASLILVNYFFYRKQVRDYLTRLQFEEDSCHISVLRGDVLEELCVPLTDLTVEVEERRYKSNILYFLCFKHNNQLIVQQFSGIGFWNQKRVQAVEAGFKNMTAVD